MKTKNKISPIEYRKTLHNLDLENIYLKKSICSVDRDSFSDNLNLITKERSSFIQKNDHRIEITCNYSVTALNENHENKKPVLEIKASFVALYKVSPDINFNQDFFDLFKQLTVSFTLWPYFREHVHSLASKMSLPSLTLPMKKLT